MGAVYSCLAVSESRSHCVRGLKCKKTDFFRVSLDKPLGLRYNV